MDDLFRFLLLRPADLPAPDEIKVLNAGFVQAGASLATARRQAQAFLKAPPAIRHVPDLTYRATAEIVAAALARGPLPLADLKHLIQAETGTAVGALVASVAFQTEEQALADTLVAVKLTSGAPEVDARGLARLAQGYDAMRRSADGADPVRLRPLVLPDAPQGVPADQPERPREPDAGGRPPDRTPPPDEEHRRRLERLETAIGALSRLPAASFAPTRASPRDAPVTSAGRLEERLILLEERIGGQQTAGERLAAFREVETSGTAGVRADQPWTLAAHTVSGLPADVRRTLDDLGIAAREVTLPAALQTLYSAHADTVGVLSSFDAAKTSWVNKIGIGYFISVEKEGLVGAPAQSMPTGHGSIKPVGIGDLLLVKQHVLRYEGGELAHVENVLKSEHLSRDTRRLERTETTVVDERETTKEEERDTQSTDRFSLKRETSQTLKQDTEFKAGLSVDAKYGPFVEVKANAEFGTHSSSEESTRQATEFSKDVVSRSASKVVERVLQRRTTTTVAEFEEKYSHGFDNTAGAGNISGVYQWVDKVLQAQVYNYGKRMLFDVVVPEPATAFIEAQHSHEQEGNSLVKPAPFSLTAAQITEGNYRTQALLYDVTGLEAPPPPVKTVSKAFDAVVSQDPHESSKSQELSIDDGYQAKYALFQCDYRFYDGASWRIMIGSNWVDAFGPDGYFDMAGEVGSVALAYDAFKIRNLAATVEIFCERTPRAMTAWQLKTHGAITQGYLAKKQAYESALAEAAAAAGVQISGRNPMWNQRIVSAELRRQAITLLTAQQFDAFGALELSAEGYPQPHLARSEQQMPYVRFFEQAFEWEHISYFCYPYFWGWKPAWRHRMLLDDVDPTFADFLRAGAARIVFPVRPGFEAAVVHYLETGEIWNGGPAPDISSSLYVPIVKEIQEAQGAPGNEVPNGDPWLVRLPTTLVKLRPDDSLPKWQKVGEDWQPVN